MNKKVALVMVFILVILICCIIIISKNKKVNDVKLDDENFESSETIELTEETFLYEYDDNIVEVIDPITKKHIDVRTCKEL